MFRYEEDAEEVIRGEREVKASRAEENDFAGRQRLELRERLN